MRVISPLIIDSYAKFTLLSGTAAIHIQSKINAAGLWEFYRDVSR